MSESPKKRPSSAPKNTAVYVSQLPEDATTEELMEYFSKCGIIMDEILTGKPRIKIYTDSEGRPKGDALIVYLREESVTLALNILDESEFRPGGTRIRVQEASFNENNTVEGGGEVVKKNRIDKETWKKHMKRMQKKLEWFDEEAEAQAREAARQERFSKILVLKHMYRPEELSDSVDFADQLAEEIIEECEERLGVTGLSVQVIEEHAEEGMCTVKFKKPIEAAAAAKLMNGRFFAGQRVSAAIYDGSFQLPKNGANSSSGNTDFNEEQARLNAFSKFIENGEENDSDSQNSDSQNSDNHSSDNDDDN